MVIQAVEEAASAPQKPGMRTQTTSPLSPSTTVLLGTTQQVTISGPGTYDQSTHTMSAPVVVTHNDATASDFDELQMVVTDIKSSGNIQFVTTNNGNTATRILVGWEKSVLILAFRPEEQRRELGEAKDGANRKPEKP